MSWISKIKIKIFRFFIRYIFKNVSKEYYHYVKENFEYNPDDTYWISTKKKYGPPKLIDQIEIKYPTSNSIIKDWIFFKKPINPYLNRLLEYIIKIKIIRTKSLVIKDDVDGRVSDHIYEM